MASSKQANRLMQFTSPLGPDVLLIESLEGAEGISRLFDYRVVLLADVEESIDPKTVVGSRVTVTMGLNDAQGARYINGIVASFEQCAGDKEFNVFQARIVPALWQLTLSSNCKVYQGMNVVDIVKKVIGNYSLSISDHTQGSYQQLDYCTQYSESDFHFISRLMEENGIFYWFEHTAQDHRFAMGDAPGSCIDCAVSAAFPYEANVKGAEGSYGAWVSEMTSTATMVTGKHTTWDYDYRPYQGPKVGPIPSASPYGENAYEQYVYPAGAEGYAKQIGSGFIPTLATSFQKVMPPVSDAVAEILEGSSNARSLCAGYTFTLKKHPIESWNRKYLLTSVNCYAEQSPPYRTNANDTAGYSNRFTAVSSDIAFKPPRTTVKPRIYGPQTAVVVAPSGEEMDIDSLGRICVQFFWDRDRDNSFNKVDNTWVRVAQHWAGNGWGTYFWPRLKDEVVVMFLNGDPDNPLVVGSVYNGVNVPKYALPGHSTRSGILTRSSKGGGAANANELRFEDLTGSEQIFLNAERDMDHRTEHDHRRWVGNNDSLVVTGTQSEQIGKDYNLQVKGNSTEQIGQNYGLQITGTSAVQIGSDSNINISSDLNEQVGGDYSLNISGNHAAQAGQNYSMKAGMEIFLNGGMNVILQAGMELCLQGSGGFITIGPSGVIISGAMVLINSGGAAVSGTPGQIKSPASPAAPAAPDIADDGTKGGAM